jgi:hypothetical protein
MIEFTQDKCDLLNNYQLVISINLRGREWVNPQGETKYFNSIQGWSEKAGVEPQAPSTYAYSKLCSGNNLNEDEQMICLLIYSTVKKDSIGDFFCYI